MPAGLIERRRMAGAAKRLMKVLRARHRNVVVSHFSVLPDGVHGPPEDGEALLIVAARGLRAEQLDELVRSWEVDDERPVHLEDVDLKDARRR